MRSNVCQPWIVRPRERTLCRHLLELDGSDAVLRVQIVNKSHHELLHHSLGSIVSNFIVRVQLLPEIKVGFCIGIVGSNFIVRFPKIFSETAMGFCFFWGEECYVSVLLCVDSSQEMEGQIRNPLSLAIDFRQQAKTIGSPQT